jgi:hypothetical protein
MSLIIAKPHLMTHLSVWTPKYNSKSLTQDYGEQVALLHKRKVDFASPVIIVEFPKAKHLQGQRFAIRKESAQKHAVGTNGAAPMYEIPLSHFESWESAQEVIDLAEEAFDVD